MDADSQRVSQSVEMMSEDLLDALLLDSLGLQMIFDGATAQGTVNNKAIAIVGDPSLSPFLRSFTREWQLGGRLIDVFRISLQWRDEKWVANYQNIEAYGTNPLIAAVRVLVKYSLEHELSFNNFPKSASRKEILSEIFRRPCT
ncbi:hypothetical protein [Undibacterium sp.]|uniref:hypothetical protein n=1 Tax=Undibacterium sp. TaxID=1914977 RepID=UPI0025D0C99E|nr:hypothetical protein [Undibacterium sp.]